MSTIESIPEQAATREFAPLINNYQSSSLPEKDWTLCPALFSIEKMIKGKSVSKPCSLKQRTSSRDSRRDYSHSTWWSLLVLLKVREFFVTVDHFSIWRRHLAWAKEDGKDLKACMTQRYGSSMVFMSLLLSTELATLFNSAQINTGVRMDLQEGNHYKLSFWAGFMIIISALLTILSLISLFTAWGMVNSIDESNAHCIFRSSIGQYCAELPGRLIVFSIYAFLTAFMMFFFLLLPVGMWSIFLFGATAFLFVHIVSTFSAFGRVIMHTGAMGKSHIFDPEYEDTLTPHTIHNNLLNKAQANLANNISISRQYRKQQRPINSLLSPEDMYDYLSGRLDENRCSDTTMESIPYRPRANSTVKFADVEAGVASKVGPLSPARITTSRDRPIPLASSLRKTSYGPLPTHRPSAPPHIGLANSGSEKLLPKPQIMVATTSISSTDNISIASNLSRASNVTKESMEQWLKASPDVSIGRKTNTHHGSASQNQVAERRSPPLPTNQLRISTGSLSTLENPETSTPSPYMAVNSQGQSTTSTSIESEISFDDRHLSEDERFSFDYGDFPQDIRAIGDSVRSNLTAPQGFFGPPATFPNLGISLERPSTLSSQSNSGELIGLLHSSNENHSYSSTNNEGDENEKSSTLNNR